MKIDTILVQYNFVNLCKRLRSSTSGATAIEYGLMASMIGILAIAGMAQLGVIPPLFNGDHK